MPTVTGSVGLIIIFQSLVQGKNILTNTNEGFLDKKQNKDFKDLPSMSNPSLEFEAVHQEWQNEGIRETVEAEKQRIQVDSIFGNRKTLPDKQGRDVSCQVLVLGAGMAGVTAARTLRKLGINDVMLVEGSNRIGGRVKDVQFGGVHVEVGANWVHFSQMGENDTNSVEEMCKSGGLNMIQDPYDDYIFRYEGKNVTAEANEGFERYEEALEHVRTIGERKEQYGEPDVNFRVGLSMASWRPLTPVERAVEFFSFDFEFGEEPEETGLRSNYQVLKEHKRLDQFVSDKRGYSQIIHNMVEKDLDLKENVNFFLNDYVREIHYNEPGEKKIRVKTKNKKDGSINIYRADYVIVTFSIGVLASNFVKFEPKLPIWKEEIMYMYQMVRYIKIFVKFPSNITAFWDDNHYIMYVDPTQRGNYQIWQNLESRGKYFPTGTNLLLVTVLGNNWERVQHLTKNQIKHELFAVLRNMYGDKAVEPEDILIPDWNHNPLFFGSYSNWPIGEACSEDFPGYLHGAVQRYF
ncbi:polyamine oxidase isoform X2 [Eurytemora carolleeae]|uniref:polyamine oxidase isoform X2 n=1 Tax=Eurytemora carolleeae TaxID=1294199 RepID=UPI000C7805CB|nr:polyamine oxidase isoform X2 [Eurytemora carolleeae]|eukprot:XP_023344218.1 polyamine oxidase-like isoform X2 [Eurytemora affinis]